MSEIVKRFSEAGIKNTKQREQVLMVLKEANTPLDAMQIHQKVNSRGIDIWISTVYRILELFTQKGIVIKNNMLGEDRATYEVNRKEHAHYAVCLSCKRILQVDFCPFEKFIPTVKSEKFYVVGHKLEMYGYCDDCNKAKSTV